MIVYTLAESDIKDSVITKIEKVWPKCFVSLLSAERYRDEQVVPDRYDIVELNLVDVP